MQITIIHGQSHKGSTYHMARMLAEKLGDNITEFFLPRDFGTFCVGCTNCFEKAENMCPHYEALKPITEALDRADVIILASPVYVYHVTGAMKNFLDHYGYRWMVHRPEERMFRKQAVCISTAAGGGMKSTNKDMADSTFFWGVAKTYRYGVGVAAVSWAKVKPGLKKRIDAKTTALARKIRRNHGKVKPSIKTKCFFYVMRLAQKSGWNPVDADYWRAKGWLGRKRPWRA
ncbi:MAG: NAD(P)H-dependent oxidoreductase [Lachnospiraceae bacterium]|jgi:multimeric flavodoxin WrbA|nr:NAD(P)H-dependent oxidoreductase [Lachnospiraceae bacterium]